LNIILGITGSIAAFKAISVGRLLLKRGYRIIPVLTKNALNFVTPLSLTSLLGEKVYYDMFEIEDNRVPIHVKLSKEADLIAIIPATFNFISKVSTGITDDLLSLLFHTSQTPKIIAPCMHPTLYENEILKAHLLNLEKQGVFVIEPLEGEMSDLTFGKGRLKEPKEIVKEIEKVINLKEKLKGKKVLLTFGRTEEEIDSVRVITNKSSGKMGYALYKILKIMGADVKAIAGKTDFELPADVKRIYTTLDFLKELKKELKKEKYDALIMCAALSDFRPSKKVERKIKKNVRSLKIEFKRNPDVIKELSKIKGNTKFIGFALEDKPDVEIAYKKLKEKKLDLIILNTVKTMGSQFIDMKIITSNKKIFDFGRIEKAKAAVEICKKISEIIQ